MAPWPVLRRCQGPCTPDALSPALLNTRAKEASVIERLLHSVLEALRMLQASMLGTNSSPSEGTSVEVAPSGAQGAGSGRSGAGPALVACPCPGGCSHRPCRPRGSQACLRTRGQPCPCTSLWAPPGVSRSCGCCCPHKATPPQKRGAGGAGAGRPRLRAGEPVTASSGPSGFCAAFVVVVLPGQTLFAFLFVTMLLRNVYFFLLFFRYLGFYNCTFFKENF